ncbi:MAG: RMD1 family protein [Gammaproteobacteria bacterium]|nr:RMD1 family protein [Gammaproteobacteria bacterium]
MMATTPGECFAIAVAELFQFNELSRDLMEQERATLYRDALHIERDGRMAVVFAYGVVITWQWSSDEREALLKRLNEYHTNTYAEPETERFQFSTSAEQFRIQRDHIYLTDTSPLHLLAVSHALAQSIKLSTFETLVARTMQSTAQIPRTLAETGKTNLSRRELAQIRGRLFLTKSDIIVRYDLLDTPEFFWEYPELESVYQHAANYLEIRNRTQVLSTRLETVHELFEMLADEQKHKHSATLEWIIIWLIAVEILMFLVNDFVLH